MLQGCSNVLLFLHHVLVLQREKQLKADIGSRFNQLVPLLVFRIRQLDVLVTVLDPFLKVGGLVLQNVLLVSERLIDTLEVLECFEFVSAIAT